MFGARSLSPGQNGVERGSDRRFGGRSLDSGDIGCSAIYPSSQREFAVRGTCTSQIPRGNLITLRTAVDAPMSRTSNVLIVSAGSAVGHLADALAAADQSMACANPPR